jgi:hypothetical protein
LNALVACGLASVVSHADAKGTAKKPQAHAPAPAPSQAKPAPASTAKPGAPTPKHGKRRKHAKLAPGSPGTLAHAIANHPLTQHAPVAEGTLPGVRAGGSCPPEMANVDDRFCVDKWEGSLVEVEADGSTKPWSPFATPLPEKTYRAVSASGVVPQGYISGAQAEAACRAAGKRLCQPVEWRHACGGSEKTVYPYGPTRVEGKCNDKGKSPMIVFYPQVQKSWNLVSTADMNDPRLNQMDGTVAKTGEYAECVNDYGIYDMVGNLHEWTADPNGTFQGGYYLDTVQNGDGCSYRTAAHDFTYHDYSTGFRCCADLQTSGGAADPAPVTDVPDYVIR